MPIRDRLSGNEAISVAMRQINPDVVAAFPITPSTEIPQYFSKYVADGVVDTEFVPVESEHSAMSACIGAQGAGARSMTATSSCGLALMWEMLYIASSSRLPITLACVNRALSGPININADHGDSMGARDSGWIQIYSEDNQEAYDNFIQAVRIGEDERVMLPVMVCQDGFITSHGVENMDLLEDKEVKEFVGEYTPKHYLLNPQEPIAMGPYATDKYYMEHKRQQVEGMKEAKEVVLKVAKEFEKISGRKYGFFEEYMLEDAEVALVAINSTAGTIKATIDEMRNEGKKVGLLKIRLFRPFPGEEISKALKDVSVVGIMDRSETFSTQGGPLFFETRSALYDNPNRPKVVNYIYGLGGRDISTKDIRKVYEELYEIKMGKEVEETCTYLGVRE
ncbi:pyruvate ferredoxin oxidoreductase [Anaeromicrobium sediminis]|uniref:Pyruvate ferredoxin oxidoreductase n=1 Tax=Anaeromicrobium sediminis TaxID=1478221 RepID=A0A267MID3_9FIRM|nr:pyruvate ferredoxin oxidoreductase [Anaeromicrobium sediminis]PAB59341.1 pyruvate ferredoxin oxidoreductase [Anaeromicrobium sediminis]